MGSYNAALIHLAASYVTSVLVITSWFNPFIILIFLVAAQHKQTNQTLRKRSCKPDSSEVRMFVFKTLIATVSLNSKQ